MARPRRGVASTRLEDDVLERIDRIAANAMRHRSQQIALWVLRGLQEDEARMAREEPARAK